MDGRRDISETNDVSGGPAPNVTGFERYTGGFPLWKSAEGRHPVFRSQQLLEGAGVGWGGENVAASASCSASLSLKSPENSSVCC